MRWDGKPLNRGMRGSSVGELQESLIRLGYRIDPHEAERRVFGESTAAALRQFQVEQNQRRGPGSEPLPETGELDERTAEALGAADRPVIRRAAAPRAGESPSTYTVTGQVERQGRPLAGVTVRAVHVGVRKESVLGEAVTDTEGAYAISYSPPGGKRPRVNLQIAVMEGETALVTSAVVINAAPDEVINLVAPEQAEEPSAFERLEALVAPHLDGVSPADLTESEQRILAAELDMEQGHLELFGQAHRLAAAHGAIPAAAYYGLLVRGLPADLRYLAATDPGELKSALEVAADERVIPASLKESAAALAGELESLSRTHRTEALQRVLETSPANLPEALRQRFTEKHVRHKGPEEQLWQELQEDPEFTPERIGELRYTMKLSRLVEGNLPLLGAMQKHRVAGEHPVHGLAALDRAGWRKLVQESLAQGGTLPPGPEGETDEQRVEAYADRLAESVEHAYPLEFIRAGLKRELKAHGSKKKSGAAKLRNPSRGRLVELLAQTPDLDLGRHVVETYLHERQPEAWKALDDAGKQGVLGHLKALQRVWQVAPRYGQMSVLLGDGLDSALRIGGTSEAAFAAHYGATLGSEHEAVRIHRRAKHVEATTAHLVTTTYQLANDVTPLAMQSLEGESLTKQMPSWSSLFGRVDLCDCAHCRSVYSPAAYLVDLFQFLNPSSPAAIKPIETLRQRRPDLEQLLLTCENTNTTLPYVDLINEVLESYIAHGQTRVNNTSPTATPEALSVNREYDAAWESTSQAAYNELANAIYPFSLPFDRSLETVRAYLDHLGSSRYELLETFPGAQPDALVAEQLRLTPQELQIINGDLPRYIRDYYGYTGDPVITPGLRGLYSNYVDPQVPNVIRIDPKIDFNWHSGTPIPGIRSDQIMVSWFGHLKPPVTDTYTLHITSDDGVRVFLNGVKIIDAWYDQGPTKHSSEPIALEAGGAYEIGIHYYENTGSAVCRLEWSRAGDPVESVIPTSALQVPLSWDLHLAQVPEFLRRTGLTFEELLELLATRFINPVPAAPALRLQVLGDVCDLQTTMLQGLNDSDYAALKRVLRFVRLWRKVGGSMADLDRALTAFGDTPDFLARYVQLRQVQKKLKERAKAALSDAELLSFWNRLDPTLYLSLFQNKAVFQPLDPDLALNPSQTQVVGTSRTLSEKLPVIMAALRIEAADLTAILADVGLTASAPLTLENLSLLHRYALLARSLKLRVAELIDLRMLTGVQPFVVEQTQSFVDRVFEIRESGFSVARLNYLLRDLASPTSGLLPAPAAWEGLARTLEQGFARIAQENPIQSDPTGEEFQRQLAGVVGSSAFTPAVGVIEGSLTWTEAEKRAFLAEHLPFLATSAVESLVQPLGSDPDELHVRRSLVVTAIVEQRVTSATDALIVQSLGQALDLTPDMVDLLLRKGLSSLSDAGQPALRDFKTTSSEALRLPYTRLHKAAMLVRLFDLTLAELSYLLDHPADFGNLNLNLPMGAHPDEGQMTLLMAQWEHLRRYVSLARQLPAGTKTLLDLFAAAGSGASLETVLWTISAATGWSYEEAASARSALWLSASAFVNAGPLGAMQRIIQLSRKLGVSIDLLQAWAGSTPDWAQATRLRDAVKARYDEAGWIRMAAPIADALRERQKESLVAYVLQMAPIRSGGITTPNQLFEYFLIDVEMSPCMKTSRIKQAISSVQLFVQRCLLNLEPAVPPNAIDGPQWEWMKHYRTWEANRKVFLYPENWLEPELRDDKSQLFRELETDLLQTDVTPETVEQAFRHYLEKLADIARLEIVATYMEYDYLTGTDKLHVVGRTYSNPHVYYYRQLVQGAWTGWDKIDVDIQSDHVVLVLSSNRLFLLWPLFERVALPEDNLGLSQGSAPRERWEIKVAWSQYQQGRWTPKRTLPKALRTRPIDSWAPWREKRRIMLQVLGYWSYNLDAFSLDVAGWPYGTINTTGWSMVEALGRFTVRSFPYSAEPYAHPYTIYWSWRLPLRTQFDSNQYEAVSVSGYPNQLAFLYYTYSYSTIEVLLNNWWDPYRLVPVSVNNFSLPQKFFFFQDPSRTYLVQQRTEGWSLLYQFHSHYHPYTREFLSRLNSGGLNGLLALSTQKLGELDTGSQFVTNFSPTALVHSSYPTEKVEFQPEESYGLYNSELFFHIPLLIADRLCKEQRFAEAQRWFHHVFNPTIDTDEPSPARFWRYLPFHRSSAEQRIWTELVALADPDGDPAVKERLANQIADWQANPFEPHRIGRLRQSAYQKSVLMKYLDNLIAWADMLFAQDTIESINEATQLYVLAANLLGPKPEQIPEMVTPVPASYSQLQAKWDDFANAVVDVQNRFPFVMAVPQSASSPSMLGVGSLYFGIPRNDKLLRYWDLVEDRLFKVRNCLNIEGVARSLALFEPPMDPALAIKAKAAGIDLGSALADTATPLGQYRFPYLVPKALELCQEVKSMGNALVSALEKKDAEALSNLRATQETAMLRLIRQVRERQVEEAKATLEGLQKSLAVVEHRHSHYKNIVHVSPREREHLDRLDSAQNLQTAGQLAEVAASAAAMFPEMQIGLSGISSPVLIADFGGINVSQALSAAGRGLNFLASLETYKANRASTLAGWDRRSEEWNLQADLAAREIEQIKRQIAAAEIRLAMAERELTNHDRQTENAQAVESFLREKYTNQELYSWMVAQVSNLFFRVYQLAYDLAKRAERAFRFERGLSHSNFIQFGYWDSLRKGLLAGERLHLDLKRMELAYLEQSTREYELTKQVSLVLHDPMALIALKETGRCRIHLPEALFDMDFPGHYMRRIRSVSLTIPCVTGPYTGIHATLTLESSRIRTSNDLTEGYADQGPEDTRFLADFSAVQSIATSHAQNDAGLFELSFRDERYLPFEGAGAISTWRLEMPRNTNAFDFDTISDVILKLQFTAREGGQAFRQAAFAAATLPEPLAQQTAASAMAAPAQQHLRRLFSLRHEFPTEWHGFLSPAPGAEQQVISLALSQERFPYTYRGRAIALERVELFLKLKESVGYSGGPLSLYLYAPNSSTARAVPLSASPAVLNGVPVGTTEVTGGLGDWQVEVQSAEVATLAPELRVQAGTGMPFHLNPEVIEDLVMLCWYRVN